MNWGNRIMSNPMKDIFDKESMIKDIAERDYINRFTTAENKVVIENISNSVNEAQDLDGMIDYLTEKLVEQVAMSASGIR